MQTLSCDLWVIEDYAFKQFKALALGLNGANRGTELATVQSEIVEMEARAGANSPQQGKRIAIIPVHGILEARPSFIGAMLGMTSYESIGKVFDQYVADESIASIVFDVMSPGGQVYGCQELAQKIYSARGRKTIISVANPMAASGGYWFPSAASRFVSVPSGDTGSIGVIAEHVDLSQSMTNDGWKVTTVRSTKSPYKGEGTDSEPLTEAAKQYMQSRADAIYEQFAGDVARFRGGSLDHVVEKFGKGRVVSSKLALSAGMIDHIDTLQGVVEKLMSGRIRLGGCSAQDNWDAPTPRERRLERVAAINSTIGDEHGTA